MTDAPIPEETLLHLSKAVSALDDRKAEDLRVLDVRETSSITDFLIVATGNSPPHLRALRSAVTEQIPYNTFRARGAPNEVDSGWTVVDAYDIVVHLFTNEQRDYYSLENLWKDAPEVARSELPPPPDSTATETPTG